MEIPVELSRIVIVDTSPQQVIVLKEVDGERSFPIVIRIQEALEIDRRFKGIKTERPLTYDLLGNVIEAMGGRPEKVVIWHLSEHTFYGKLVVSQDGQVHEVDCRPSDAIALAVGLGTPIFVAEHVLDTVMKDAGDLTSQRESLQLRHEQLCDQISFIRQRLKEEGFNSGADDIEVRSLKEHFLEMQAELDAIEEILRQLPK